jgi:hypothetical protein
VSVTVTVPTGSWQKSNRLLLPVTQTAVPIMMPMMPMMRPVSAGTQTQSLTVTVTVPISQQ